MCKGPETTQNVACLCTEGNSISLALRIRVVLVMVIIEQ